MPDHIHGIIEITFQKKKGETEIGTFKSPSETIGAIIRGFKIATIKKIKEKILNAELNDFPNSEGSSSTGESQFAPIEFPPIEFAPIEFTPTEFAPTKEIIRLNFKIWQRNYYEHIIRDERAYENISAYIKNNPSKWKEDEFAPKSQLFGKSLL